MILASVDLETAPFQNSDMSVLIKGARGIPGVVPSPFHAVIPMTHHGQVISHKTVHMFAHMPPHMYAPRIVRPNCSFNIFMMQADGKSTDLFPNYRRAAFLLMPKAVICDSRVQMSRNHRVLRHFD